MLGLIYTIGFIAICLYGIEVFFICEAKKEERDSERQSNVYSNIVSWHLNLHTIGFWTQIVWVAVLIPTCFQAPPMVLAVIISTTLMIKYAVGTIFYAVYKIRSEDKEKKKYYENYQIYDTILMFAFMFIVFVLTNI